MKKRSRRKRLPLPRRPFEWGLAIVAIALVAIAITSLGSSSSSSSAATKRTTTVGKGVVQSTVSGNGTLEPAQKVELSFGASGEVTKIYVKSGQKVTKGEVLAEVDSSSARASLASAKASLLEAEEAVETSEEAEVEAEEEEAEETAYEGGATTEFIGLMSENGTAAAGAEGESTATATEGSTEAATSEKEEAATKEETSTAKGKEGTTKGKETSTGTAKPAAEEAAPEKAAPEKEATTENVTPEVTRSESSSGEATGGGEATPSGAAGGGATISLPTAEANLREAQLSVKSARQEVRETTLRAPISGTIASISGAVGETVTGGSSSGGGTSEASTFGATGGASSSSGSSSGSAFMVLAQLSRLKMEVSFSESDIGKVRKGQTATVSVDSLEGTELSGEVTKLSVLPSEEGSSVVEYPATILLTQSAKGLRAGMSASAEVVVEQVKNAITVSSEALSGKTVTVEEGGKEVTKTVTTGLAGDETTQIISGLKVGDTVVLPEAKVATATAGGEGESGAAKAGFGGFGGAAAGGHFGGGGGFPAGGFGGGAP
ncbi:MAG TPA: HlyD family efflux transporter periplasmic adaptor subunit [Solirubrobacterales bacterium]|nr:HlyD family efflux transporter periplasmic adaptor subunit [Solirubrobacterales bacterium]